MWVSGSNWQIVFIALFLFVALVQLFYYLYYYAKIYSLQPVCISNKTETKLTVIVCAHNEENNIARCVDAIMRQKYNNFELIVVNDCSTDDTGQIASGLKCRYKNLQVLHRRANAPSKKKAITQAIETAKTEWLVFTDADCKPAGQYWLQTLAGYCNSNKTEIILGYGAYEMRNGWQNSMIRYETMFIALQYFTFTMRGIPYMATGRNMAYRKSLFCQINGFGGYENVLSGDDDLFIKKAASSNNISLAVGYQSITYSKPKATIKAWIKQKQRHITTAGYYKKKQKILVSGELLSRFIYNLMLIVLVFVIFASETIGIEMLFVASVVLIRSVVLLILQKKATLFFYERKLLSMAIVFDIIIPFLYLYIGFLNIINPKTKTWK